MYLSWTAWVLPGGAGDLAAGVLLRVLKKFAPARWVLLGGGHCPALAHGLRGHGQGPAQALESRTVPIQGEVLQWPEETLYGARLYLKAGEPGGKPVKALFYGERDLLSPASGDRIETVAECSPPTASRGGDLLLRRPGLLPPDEAPGRDYRPAPGGFSLRTSLTLLAGTIMDQIDRLYPQQEAGFLRALLMGDKSGLEDIDQNHFNRVGLGHVVVISGFHVSVLMGFLALFLNPKKKRNVAVILLLLVAFCCMTGSDPGTVRATVLCALAMLAPLVGRSYDSITGLCAALLLLLAWNPWAVANAGPQFSFLSTLGILVFGLKWYGAWRARVPERGRKWAAPWLACAAVSLSAMVFTVPLSGLYFGQFSLVSPWPTSAPNGRWCWPSWAGRCPWWPGLSSPAPGAGAGRGGGPAGGLLLLVLPHGQRLSLAALRLDIGLYAGWVVFVYGVLILCLWRINRYPDRHLPRRPAGGGLRGDTGGGSPLHRLPGPAP